MAFLSKSEYFSSPVDLDVASKHSVVCINIYRANDLHFSLLPVCNKMRLSLNLLFYLYLIDATRSFTLIDSFKFLTEVLLATLELVSAGTCLAPHLPYCNNIAFDSSSLNTDRLVSLLQVYV